MYRLERLSGYCRGADQERRAGHSSMVLASDSGLVARPSNEAGSGGDKQVALIATKV